MIRFCTVWLVGSILVWQIAAATSAKGAEAESDALTIVVMDPLAQELSCPCVKGYAQRNYQELGKFLGQRLNRKVEIAFSESLVTALRDKTNGRADLVIGKCSVVKFDAMKASRSLAQIVSLTGKDGLTTQCGLIVVQTGDPPQKVTELAPAIVLSLAQQNAMRKIQPRRSAAQIPN